MANPGDSAEQLQKLVGFAEAAVERMYDARAARGAYADAKDCFADAIGMAERLGLAADAARLEARLAEVKAVFRGQGLG